MAKIIPFQAVRPTRDKVCFVTCRSYEEYVNAELAAQLDFNPLVFFTHSKTRLHQSRNVFLSKKDTDKYIKNTKISKMNSSW